MVFVTKNDLGGLGQGIKEAGGALGNALKAYGQESQKQKLQKYQQEQLRDTYLKAFRGATDAQADEFLKLPEFAQQTILKDQFKTLGSDAVAEIEKNMQDRAQSFLDQQLEAMMPQPEGVPSLETAAPQQNFLQRALANMEAQDKTGLVKYLREQTQQAKEAEEERAFLRQKFGAPEFQTGYFPFPSSTPALAAQFIGAEAVNQLLEKVGTGKPINYEKIGDEALFFLGTELFGKAAPAFMKPIKSSLTKKALRAAEKEGKTASQRAREAFVANKHRLNSALGEAKKEGIDLQKVIQGDKEAVREWKNLTNKISKERAQVSRTFKEAEPSAYKRRQQVINDIEDYTKRTKRIGEEVAEERGRLAEIDEKVSKEGPKVKSRKEKIKIAAKETLPKFSSELQETQKALGSAKDDLRVLKSQKAPPSAIASKMNEVNRLQSTADLQREALKGARYEARTGKPYTDKFQWEVKAFNDVENLSSKLESKPLSDIIKENKEDELYKKIKGRREIPGTEKQVADTKTDMHRAYLKQYDRRLKEVNDMLKAQLDERTFAKLNKEKSAIEALQKQHKQRLHVHKRRRGLQDIGRITERKEAAKEAVKKPPKLVGKEIASPFKNLSEKNQKQIYNTIQSSQFKEGAAGAKPKSPKREAVLDKMSNNSKLSKDSIKKQIDNFGENFSKIEKGDKTISKPLLSLLKLGGPPTVGFISEDVWERYPSVRRAFGGNKGAFSYVMGALALASGGRVKGFSPSNILKNSSSYADLVTRAGGRAATFGAGKYAQSQLTGQDAAIRKLATLKGADRISYYQELRKKYGNEKAQQLLNKGRKLSSG